VCFRRRFGDITDVVELRMAPFLNRRGVMIVQVDFFSVSYGFSHANVLGVLPSSGVSFVLRLGYVVAMNDFSSVITLDLRSCVSFHSRSHDVEFIPEGGLICSNELPGLVFCMEDQSVSG
jgi:hypothetical protein